MPCSMSYSDLIQKTLDRINYNRINIFGSGALNGKILLVRILENNKIDHYFSSGLVK